MSNLATYQEIYFPPGLNHSNKLNELIRIQKLVPDGLDQSLFVVHQSKLKQRYQLLKSLLPQCTHYFAVKSCPVPEVIKILKSEGSCFDLASNGEIDLMLAQGISTQRCIHTHPIKRPSDIQYAIEKGIRVFVVDNIDELAKFKAYQKEVSLLVRIAFSNQDASINLSSKFGMKINEVFDFIVDAVSEGYQIDGVSFHVGSQMLSNKPYIHALHICNTLYEDLSQMGIHLSTLDIGGGFPYQPNETQADIEAFFAPIQACLQKYFPHIHCITEPGRFISAPVASLICCIQGKRKIKNEIHYYLNDGVYGVLSGKVYDLYQHEGYEIFRQQESMEKGSLLYNSTFYGPTCDSIDKIIEGEELSELQIGDCLIFHHIGAYSIASASNFNMLGQTQITLII